MSELINILETNNIKYQHSVFGHTTKSILIKKRKYEIEIYENEHGLVSDLRKIPYTWGKMGSATLDSVLRDLEKYLEIKIKHCQTDIFDFI